MCGIVGYIGKENCLEKILKGLESLEYRGYDSAGVAYVENNEVKIIKCEGRIKDLREKVDPKIKSNIGIGHTRWATHGKPSDVNSHPHKVGKITVVHNGIIENYNELKGGLLDYEFQSETDTEVIAAIIDKMYALKGDMLKVLADLKYLLTGSYALGILVDGEDKIYAIRKDSPLIIGVSPDGNYIASDVPAILEFTNMYYLILNDEYAVLDGDDVVIYDRNGNVCPKDLLTFDGSKEAAQKGGYEHFMLKEINEQPKVVMDTINPYLDNINLLDEYKLDQYEHITIIGCGSAYHVGLVGKNLLMKYGLVDVDVDIASEYRYTDHIYNKKELIILISQSGETADTLAVLRKAKEEGIDTLAIVNVVGSSIARESDNVIYIKAGPEIAVATTKAYMCQLAVLSIMACYLGIKNKHLKKSILDEYKSLSADMEELIKDDADTKRVANLIYNHKDIFYIGRKVDYALCMEASLKLKEVSYLHCEAYAAGELKHGTISLVDKKTPVLSIITDDDIAAKTISNVKEVCSRGALSIVITNNELEDHDLYKEQILIPKRIDLIESMLVVVKCQLIAYYTAKLNGCDIDKPRNLAKSVTVE
ncbi:MAG: glutamine--fructose-6-phosphate transaminase (isomerizing) [Bacilli bacterium]|nr:glutamine--fructose-6-phosphate transaminase (isomerizing) [Bacilli bacterium]